MPNVGDEITPTIRLVRELGVGGMGSVWVADHRALQTQVVVKFMHAEVAADRESAARFSREAAASANVKSPHVVQMLDHGIAPNGAPFIVMELLDGEDLGVHCERRGTVMSLQDVDVVISQACKALARAHERGIVHRDIKPQNIFLTNAGAGEVFVKVLDFGIAKASDLTAAAGSGTKTGAMVGTPYYMSPEQVVGSKSLDYRTDLWALGVVAYECVTGQRVFDAETVGGLAVAICGAPFPVPTQVNPALPASFDRWFSRACARDVSARFSSAKEMADALHAVATGAPEGNRAAISGAWGGPPPVAGMSSNLAATRELAVGASTQAPVTHGERPAGVPRRGGVVLGIAGAVVVLIVAGVGFKLVTRGTTAQATPAPLVDTSPTAAPPPPPSTGPAATPPTTASAAASTAPPALARPPATVPASQPRASPPTPPTGSKPTAPQAPAAPTNAKDRDRIE